MKCTGLSESQRLEILLENALLIEASKWKVPCFLVSTIKGTDISPMQYEQTVLWMKELKLRFNFYPETFGLAVSILNRILASVKVQVKYLQCIAVTCLYLAAKTNEEDEIIPSVKKLAMQSGCLYSSAEILRMERIILDKLQWDLYTSTPVDFLNTVDHVELIHCKELVDRCLGTETNPVYIFISANKDIKTRIRDHVSYCLPSVTCSTLKRNKTVHKATFEMETDEFYDGFQLLYNEDRGEMNDTLMSKKSQIVTEESGLCPPLTVPISELVSSL
ncbi:cyclin-I2 isoform X2 [Dendropsophus ebraccatus]|uniref:cyclin-I2 isoform X2 n=1 Tax=Dendropsophus ebraccatus TaxID=150705 RepID=UPI003830FDB2